MRNPRVLGSVARGHDTDASDLDLLVELPRPSFVLLEQVKQAAEEALGLPVDDPMPPRPAALTRRVFLAHGLVAALGVSACGRTVLRGAAAAPAATTSEVVALSSSWRLRGGTRPDGPGGTYDGTFVEDHEYVEGSGDLDVANGRVAVTPEYPDGTYLYVLTDDFPVIPRLFAGAVDPSFVRSGRPPA